MAKKKEDIEDKAEETIDDLVEESTEDSEELEEETQEEVISSVSSEPTILSEETEETQSYSGQEQRVISTTESELEETASEAPTPTQENIEYEVSGPLSSVGSKEEEIDLKYNPEKMYESEYKPSDRIEENKKDEEKKAYTTKRDIIT
jgi:hypothetical protein